MATKDPRVDVYIVKSADFAKPILKHLRKIVHAGCPKVEETIITGAKREATRKERLATPIEWLAEGKPRNWKYVPVKK